MAPLFVFVPNMVVRLFRKDKVRYENRGHAETQAVEGLIAELENDLIDENHKGIDEWTARQVSYAENEAIYELNLEGDSLRMRGLWSKEALERRHTLKRLSTRLPARALFYFLYSYFIRLRFLEGVDRKILFCHACVFALTSISENFGNTILEAMSRGVPVLATDGVGAASIVKKSYSGLVVAYNGDEIEKGPRKLLSEPRLREKMARSGQVSAQGYQWQDVAAHMQEFYEQIVGGGDSNV